MDTTLLRPAGTFDVGLFPHATTVPFVFNTNEASFPAAIETTSVCASGGMLK